MHDAKFFKFPRSRGVGRVLDFDTIPRCKPFVGRMLGVFGDGVLEALQGFFDGVGHGDVKVFFWIVPINGQSTVLSARAVNCDGVIISERIEEVGGVVGGRKLDAKVVYSEGEGGGKDRMGPKAGGIFHGGILMGL